MPNRITYVSQIPFNRHNHITRLLTNVRLCRYLHSDDIIFISSIEGNKNEKALSFMYHSPASFNAFNLSLVPATISNQFNTDNASC